VGSSAASRPLLVLQHSACEPPGVYEDELIERGIELRRVIVGEGERLPDWRGHAGLLVMGGAMGVGHESAHPWLVEEKRLIADAVRSGLPYWGVCLGAQLLAATLGAAVRRAATPEVGVLPVQRTAAGAGDPVFADAPEVFESLQWHNDTFELPTAAVQLARSDVCEQQAFRLGRAYAVQFHLEVDLALARRWVEVPDYLAELEQHGGPGAGGRLLAQVEASQASSVPLARRLFASWLVRVAGFPARPGAAPEA
jgi:GMP synthase (glutamine-hydrolysing)